jgi:predicted metal-dependent peptidase
MDEKLSKEMEIMKGKKKVEMLEMKVLINQIKATLIVLSVDKNNQKKEYQEMEDKTEEILDSDNHKG